MKVVEASHTNNIPPIVVGYVQGRFESRNEFFAETIILPDNLPPLYNNLIGPVCGDQPVVEDEVCYVIRPGRTWRSRVITAEPRMTRVCTVIAGPYAGEPCVLYTIHGGPKAERELGDPSLTDSKAVTVSQKFWATHALVNPYRS